MGANQPEASTRRAAISRLGLAAAGAAVAAQAGIVLRSVFANVSADPPSQVKVGPPDRFAAGLTFVEAHRLFIVRDGRHFRALSAVCTHLGCTVHAEAMLQSDPADADARRATQVFRLVCPCHGSRYDASGANLSGPAPRPLPAYRLRLAPDDGQLVADIGEEVDPREGLTLS